MEKMATQHGNVWRFIRRRKKVLENEHGIPPLLTADNDTINSNKKKTNALATFFKEQQSLTINKSDNQTKLLIEHPRFLFSNTNPETPVSEHTSPRGIYNNIGKTRPYKAPGSDGIQHVILNNLEN